MIYDEFVKSTRRTYTLIDASGGEGYASLVLTEDTMYLSAISLTLKKRVVYF